MCRLCVCVGGQVMLSSAGVTRPAWSDDKKARLPGAADIPIVRLNPLGILGLKCDAEQVEKLAVAYAQTASAGRALAGTAKRGQRVPSHRLEDALLI